MDETLAKVKEGQYREGTPGEKVRRDASADPRAETETVEHGACERWQEGRLRGWVKGATSKKVQCCSKGLGPYRSKDLNGNHQTL